MRIKHLFAAALLAAGTTSGVLAQSTLSLGNYDDISSGDFEKWDNAYEGSSWEVAPINYGYKSSGSQIIYTADELVDLARKNITGINLKAYVENAYIDAQRNVKVFLSEVQADAFHKDTDTKKYLYFDTKLATKVFDGSIEIDTYSYDYNNTDDIALDFDTPFYYSGDNNLLVTVIADTDDSGDVTSDLDNLTFYYVEGDDDRALTHANSKESLLDLLQSDDNFARSQYSISTVAAPVLQFVYEDGEAAEEKFVSYVTKYDTDFGVSGVTAYVASATTSTSVTLEEVASAKAGTAVLLKTGLKPSFAFSAGAASVDNRLKASDGSVTGGDNIYALSTINGKQGFYKVSADVTIPKGKAYLELDGSVNAKDFLTLEGRQDGQATGISTVQQPQQSAAPTFDLQGRSVSGRQLTKGVYVRNGKKIVVR